MKHMKQRPERIETVILDKIVNGGQALGQLQDGQAEGKKVFVWGALPGETGEVLITKSKRDWAEGVARTITVAAPERVEPSDPDSYLSTSPWQIMSYEAENSWKQQLVLDSMQQHGIEAPQQPLAANEIWYGYRNKVEFSWYWSHERDRLELSFFARGGRGKMPVEGTSLANPVINAGAIAVRDALRESGAEARSLKTLLIRCDQQGRVNAQLYVKREKFDALTDEQVEGFGFHGFSIIYSNPKSPASVITKLLGKWGDQFLEDTILDVPFRYANEGFFQVNIPAYEAALTEMKKHVLPKTPVLDMYSGVGSIGLTIGGEAPTLVEISAACVDEMRRNAKQLGRDKVTIIQAASELALESITAEATTILDPPRAGLHDDVTARLLEVRPPRIIYLSCNPPTQMRDVARLAEAYDISYCQAFNFFPRTPHIENLMVLDRRVST